MEVVGPPTGAGWPTEASSGEPASKRRDGLDEAEVDELVTDDAAEPLLGGAPVVVPLDDVMEPVKRLDEPTFETDIEDAVASLLLRVVPRPVEAAPSPCPCPCPASTRFSELEPPQPAPARPTRAQDKTEEFHGPREGRRIGTR